MEGATTAVTPYNENASPRFSGGNVSARIACAIGCSPPPPAPCTTRANSSHPRLHATPHSSEVTVKIRMQIMKKRFRPKIPTNHPLTGRIIALETRYEVSTHVLSSL